jgi:S1-C subfamily serine protease
MSKRILKVAGLLAALALIFAIGAVVGGGAVYAATQGLPGRSSKATVVMFQAEDEEGIVIASVAPDSPAAEAGVQRGDILLRIDGERMDRVTDVFDYLGEREPGDDVELALLHGDEERNLTATLGERDGRAYLGIVPCGPGAPGVVAVRLRAPGARITQVAPDSPAEQAGLEEGDLITAVDGEELGPGNELSERIAQHEPGDTITLEVTNPDGESREVTVTLGEHPEDADRAYLGVTYQDSVRLEGLEGTPMPFQHPFYFRFEGGAMVRQVAEDSPAEAAGLEPGDVITAFDGEAVDGPQAVSEALAQHEPGDLVRLSVYRPAGDETLEIEATLAEHPEDEERAYLGVSTGYFMRGRPLEAYPPGPGLRILPPPMKFEIPFDSRPFQFDGELRWFEYPRPAEPDCCPDGGQTA